jgi:hypothetical protein
MLVTIHVGEAEATLGCCAVKLVYGWESGKGLMMTPESVALTLVIFAGARERG